MTTAPAIFDRLLEVTVLLSEDMSRSFAGTGLTTARTHLLWVVRRLGPSTQQTIAAALEVSPRNVTGLVDALETTGYVRRRPHPDDRRATLVSLTPLGRRTVATMETDRLTLAARLVDGIDSPSLDTFTTVLDLITDRLRGLIAAADTPAEAATR